MLRFFDEVLLGQPEVYHVDLTVFSVMTHHKVLRLYVSVQYTPTVDILDPLQHLVAYHECSLEIKLFAIRNEQRF